MTTARDKLQYAGDYTIEKLKIHTIKGFFDLSNTMVQLDLFENIFSHAISGSLVFVDTDNILINCPIVGQEYLELKISSPGISGTDAIDFSENVLSVYKIGYVNDISKGGQMVELHLISPEFLKNQRLRVSKFYEEQSTDQIIEDLLTNTEYIDTKKDIFLNSTKGSRNILSPNFHPFDLIKNITTESNDELSSNGEVNFHLFFENTKGYHFKSLSYLYGQPTNNDFHVGDIGTIDKTKKELDSLERVISHERVNSNDMLQNIVSGLLGSTLTVHDIYNKKYDTYTYNYFDSYDQKFPWIHRERSNPVYFNDIIDSKNRTVGDFENSRIHLMSRSGDTKNKFYSSSSSTDSGGDISSISNGSNLLARRAKFAELTGMINYNIKVTGHTSMRVGETINFFVPTVGNPHGQGRIDKYLTGVYLVKQLRHSFYRSPKKHEVAMSISKDSLYSSLGRGDIEEPKRTGNAFVTRLISSGGDYGGM